MATQPASAPTLPPLPSPPPAALAYLHQRYLPSLPHSRHLNFAELPDHAANDEYLPPAVEQAFQGYRARRAVERAKKLNEVGDSDDEWEDEGVVGGSLDGKDSALKHLIALSRHPALVKGSVRSGTGVFVALRHGPVKGGEDIIFERMPLASRLGMTILYHGLDHGRLANTREVERMMKRWSIKEGRKFDDPRKALSRIEAFVRAYDIDCFELLEPDLRNYPTLNSFFYRRLRPGTRPIASPRDATVISSAADCRLTVFRSVEEAQKLWIKGKHFTLASLLRDKRLATSLKDGAVAIFRLAPADYHRFHSPINCTVGPTSHIPGSYYTVNSMIVRDKRFDVFTANKRDVTVLEAVHPLTGSQAPVAFVQVGALLVASIKQTAKEGAKVKRGDELGYFAYGGSTIVAVFPKGSVRWHDDLLKNSEGRNAEGMQLETLVKVGEKIGRWVLPPTPPPASHLS
ncbi:putative Phosphatidylserine decarboxylase proenzyme 2 (putative) [Rhodotorula toruloides]|nr:putative Phosphatidylserine decarboxylase proenzyme 2 (putative) [Rhodotorula toruloides]